MCEIQTDAPPAFKPGWTCPIGPWSVFPQRDEALSFQKMAADAFEVLQAIDVGLKLRNPGGAVICKPAGDFVSINLLLLPPGMVEVAFEVVR